MYIRSRVDDAPAAAETSSSSGSSAMGIDKGAFYVASSSRLCEQQRRLPRNTIEQGGASSAWAGRALMFGFYSCYRLIVVTVKLVLIPSEWCNHHPAVTVSTFVNGLWMLKRHRHWMSERCRANTVPSSTLLIGRKGGREATGRALIYNIHTTVGWFCGHDPALRWWWWWWWW